MCGIAGFWGDFEPELLDRMTDVLAHRGPDDRGTWHDRTTGVGLGHRRLSILDLSAAGHQPMGSPDEDVVIVYNGEVFNFRELRSGLEADGVSFRSDTDTEVLLHLYLRDGPDFLGALNGMFALALWDRRSRELLLARDGIGVKPLYVAHTPRGLVFASELKSVLQSRDVPRDLDMDGILYHLGYLWCPAPTSALKAVRKLEPGQAMLLREGRPAREWHFYRVPTRPSSDLLDIRPEEAADRIREALALAVRRQMVSDVPVGAFLSGGLDSSAVVAFAAREAAPRRLQCFTIQTEGDSASEGITEDLPYARRVAEHLDVDLHVVDATRGMTDRLERALWFLDEPQGDLAALNAWMIAELAREQGIVVLLSGAGGDDIFSGYRRHLALQGERAWSWIPRPGRRVLGGVARRLPTGRARLRQASKAFRHADAATRDRLISYFVWPDSKTLASLPGPRLQGHVSTDRLYAPLRHTLDALPGGTSPLEAMLALEMRHFLADHNLNYTDKMGMAAGVEVRVPLLDPDLVDLACQLPANLKVHGRQAKWIFKKAMEPMLPHDVIYRPKTGFGVPLRRWLAEGSMPELLSEALSPRVVRDRGLFDADAVQALLTSTRAGRADGSYVLLEMAAIELWCRRFVDADLPTPPSETR